GILSWLAYPKVVAMDEIKLDAAARRMAADLRYAQSLAMSRRVIHGLLFEPSLGRYTVFAPTSGSPITDPADRARPMRVENTSIRSGDARNATIAAQLAQAKMEELAADRNSPTRGFSYLVAANYPAESPVPAFPGYSRSVAFASDSTYDGVTFRTVGVTVVCPNIPPVTLTTWFTSY